MADSDDDMPLSSFRDDAVLARKLQSENGRPRRTSKPVVNMKDLSDSEDDMPLSALKTTTPARKSSSSSKKSSSSAKRKSSSSSSKASKSSPAKKKKTASSTSSSASKSSAGAAGSFAVLGMAGTQPKTAKHELAESIMRRWTYCLPLWPQQHDLTKSKPPKGYIACGFQGVYVGVYGDDCGVVKDMRINRENAPTQDALMAMPSEALKELMVNGLNKQIQALQEKEQRHVVKMLLPMLEKDLKAMNKLNTKTIEREFSKWTPED